MTGSGATSTTRRRRGRHSIYINDKFHCGICNFHVLNEDPKIIACSFGTFKYNEEQKEFVWICSKKTILILNDYQ